MKYLDDNFLLQSPAAKDIYAAIRDLPIIDYHCHLEPSEIAANRQFENIARMWLGENNYGDHYKWRAMRANGVAEEYITGSADDYQKFEKWAETMADCLGNPLHHWTHLELRRYFGYEGVFNKETAKEVWDHCNGVLTSGDFNVGKIFDKFNVEVVCTTDDPADDLQYHKDIKGSGQYQTKVLPALRPSSVLNIESPGWRSYMNRLGDVCGGEITSFEDIVAAMYQRIAYFHENGCTLSDHALDPPVYEESSPEEIKRIVGKALAGEALTGLEIRRYKTALLVALGKEYGRRGWVMQLHIGCIRNTNTRMFERLGADTGYDAIGDEPFAYALVHFLDALEKDDLLPKTILYCLNPRDNEVLASIAGCYQGGGVQGKMQFGSGWWFNDQKDGMTRQITALASMGMLSRFVGMLTDSRSFLSYTRHEYFRRLLANILGGWLENGEVPDDMESLKKMAANIAYYNAKAYFNFS